MRESIVRPHWSWMILILLLAYALTIPYLQTYALWYDEIFTHIQSGTGNLNYKEMSVVDVTISTALTGAASPPLYYIMQNVWSQFAGNTLVSEHILPLLLGLINIAVMYRFGKSLFGETGGLLSALLYGTSTLFLYYMHETRFYTLYPLMIAYAGWYYWQLVQGKNISGRSLKTGLILSIALALYTHYIAGAFILGIAVYHLSLRLIPSMKLDFLDNERWASISKLWINGCLLFVPWLAIMLTHLGFESLSDRDAPFHILLRDTIISFGNNLWFITIPLLVMTIFLWRKPVIRFLWIWLFTSGVLITIVNIFASFLFHPRHIIPLLIPFVLLMVSAILEVRKNFPRLALILVGIWIGAGIFYSSSLNLISTLAQYQRPLSMTTLTGMQDVTNQCVQEDDYIIFSLEDTQYDLFQTGVIQYYFQELPSNYKMLGRFLTNDADLPEAQSDTVRLSREEILSSYDNIWLIARSDIDNQEDRASLETIMSENDYLPCELISNQDNTHFIAYTQDEASCQVLRETCP